ncbi:MAG TPA: L,D-transpeptidase family protein, partial [Aggregatilineales bacterium]|nr:L,D-transpeptidase family protein [Aggregatilineales bacterium]
AIDASLTGIAAQNFGRGQGSLFIAMFGSAHVAPVLDINRDALARGLKDFEPQIDSGPTNATIHLVNGEIRPVPAAVGHTLNLDASLQHILQFASTDLASGPIELVTTTTQPEVADVTLLMARARTLLSSPLRVTAYDPIADEQVVWTIPPTQWGSWLSTRDDGSKLTFSVDHDSLAAYFRSQTLTRGRLLNVDESVSAVQSALGADSTNSTIRLYNSPTKYQVKARDTIGSIAWSVGIPQWQIGKANPTIDMDNLSVGQTITIPSKDVMVPLPVIPNKRIVVSISRQHMTVYENHQVKWDWVASTGIPDSPTMAGVFQVQSHYPQAYAGLWNLNMPNFMGIYDVAPGFTNGIHGFPTRNGVGLLWENDLGHKVTFGCVLVSSQNAQLLYNWAEDGVVVEIQP